MKDSIKIKLYSQYSLLISDVILRIIILIFIVLNPLTSPFIIVLIHLITMLIFFYFIKKRKLGIETFIKTRSKSYSKFSASKRKIIFELKGDRGIFTLITLVSSIILTASIIFPFASKEVSDSLDFEFPLYFLLCFITSSLLYIYNHDNFVKENIVSVQIDDELVPHKEIIEYKKFLDLEKIDNSRELFFDNDDWIIEISRKVNEYRIKAETFLIESVFLGALTFSAFLAIAGPEGYAQITDHNSESLINNFLSAMGSLDFKVLLSYFNEIDKIYFLIATGSIICSVFYIAVLLKRYPIIRNIEILSSGLERAKVWNEREENILNLELERSELDPGSEKMKLLKSKRVYFSDKIQLELANCDKYKIEIDTKFQLISIIRLIGLYIFFFILFISSRIIHPDLCIILFIILVYAIISAKLIDYHYVSLLDKKESGKYRKYFNY